LKILEVHLNSTSPWLKFRIKFQLLFEKNFDNSFVFMKHRFSSDTEKWLRFKLQVTRKPDQGKIVADENWLESSKQRWLFIVLLFAVINVTKAIFSSPSFLLFTRTCRKKVSKMGKKLLDQKINYPFWFCLNIRNFDVFDALKTNWILEWPAKF